MPHYRDSETGRFVSEITYNRSVSHGGERYSIEYSEKEREKQREEQEEIPIADYDDFFIDEGFEGEDRDEYI